MAQQRAHEVVVTVPDLTPAPALLLPVRLETRRIADDLCIRVFPDQPFVDSHNEQLTEQERADGVALQAIVSKDDWSTQVEQARGEWQELARRHGPHRAAWILKELKSGSPRMLPAGESQPPPRLFLLPERFVFFVYEDDKLAYKEEGSPITGNLTLLPTRGPVAPSTMQPIRLLSRRDGPPPVDGLFDEGSRWLKDFQRAIDVGLGIRIALRREHRSRSELHFSQIVVVGIRAGGDKAGVEAFGEFVRSHHYTDGFEFLKYGTPTNNTAQGASAHSESEEDLIASFDVEVLSPLAEMQEERRQLTVSAQLLKALGQDANADFFQHIKGADLLSHATLPTLLRALWPATGDYFLTDLLGLEQADVARRMLLEHVARFLRPRGVFPAIRIGELPYGVLPVSRIRPASADDPAGWAPSAHDHPSDSTMEDALAFDARMQQALNTLLPLWLERANDPSAVPRAGAGYDPDGEVLKLLGMAPHCLDFRARSIVDQTVVGVLLVLFRESLFGERSSFAMLADENTSVAAWAAEKQRFTAATISLLWAMGVDLEAVHPFLLRCFAWGEGYDIAPLVSDPDQPTDSPEVYLDILAQQGASGPRNASRTLLYDLIRRSLERNDESVRPAVRQLAEQAKGSRTEFLEQLDAGLRDTVDALTYRLDAWYTALHTRRFEALRVRKPSSLYWGAYGYLEDLSLPGQTAERGKPATGGGFIQAPTVAHATAAAMFRSAFDAHRDGEAGNPYAINLTSNRVRRALELIDGVQQGQELGVLLGVQFEADLHRSHLQRLIDVFRAAFPWSAPDDDSPTSQDAEEVARPRNVCDGRELIDAYSTAEPFAELAGDDREAIAQAIAELGSGDREALYAILNDLRDSADAVGDLLQFESVFQLGNPVRSGAAMDACSGLGRPPDIESMSTPIGGINLRHRVCVLIPPAAAAASGLGQRAAAQPQLNAWIESLIGSLSNIGCHAYVEGSTSRIPVHVGDLAISPLDFIYMCAALPGGQGDTAIELRIRRLVRSTHPLTDQAMIRLELGEPPNGKRALDDAMEVGRAILDMLGSATALTPLALTHPDQPAGPPFFSDEEVDALFAQTNPVLETLRREVDAPTARALDICAEFGIEEAVTDAVAESAIAERTASARKVANDRIKVADGFMKTANRQTMPAGTTADERVRSLTSALQALFGDSFAVLPTYNVPRIAAQDTSSPGKPVAVFDGTTMASTPSEDRVWLWLQQVADTHPRVRKFETFLMAIQAWRNASPTLRVAQLPPRSDLGWQALADTELTGTAGRASGCQSIVAFVPQGVDVHAASGLVIDEWTETIPAHTVPTGVAFEYDQPASQAPHCFLLAVPGNPEQGNWSVQDLADIVRDTVELAKVRLVDLDARPGVAGVLPALMLPISGNQPVRDVPAYPLDVAPGRRDPSTPPQRPADAVTNPN